MLGLQVKFLLILFEIICTVVIGTLRAKFKYPAKIEMAFLKCFASDDDLNNSNSFESKKQVVRYINPKKSRNWH